MPDAHGVQAGCAGKAEEVAVKGKEKALGAELRDDGRDLVPGHCASNPNAEFAQQATLVVGFIAAFKHRGVHAFQNKVVRHAARTRVADEELAVVRPGDEVRRVLYGKARVHVPLPERLPGGDGTVELRETGPLRNVLDSLNQVPRYGVVVEEVCKIIQTLLRPWVHKGIRAVRRDVETIVLRTRMVRTEAVVLDERKSAGRLQMRDQRKPLRHASVGLIGRP